MSLISFKRVGYPVRVYRATGGNYRPDAAAAYIGMKVAPAHAAPAEMTTTESEEEDSDKKDEELPDWGPSAQAFAEEVTQQQRAISKYRKDDKQTSENILRKYIQGILHENYSPRKCNEEFNVIIEMLVVRTMVFPSTVGGEGLYAAEFIPKNTVVSRWIEGHDKTFSNEFVEKLGSQDRKKFKELASWDGDSWFLSGDDGIYFNHSKSPNIRVIMGRNSPATWDRVAIRDIQPGEELTMDYREIGLDSI
jgi:hypothetical protein